jgi:SRSO17 transposase
MASTIAGGRAYLADVARRLVPYCARSQSRDRVLAYLRGLLREVERKHSWPVAAVCGEATPYGLQCVLSRADGEADAVRDERHTSIRQHLGEPHGVLVLDATGCLKQGPHSAAVARQYSGTAGQVDNCHIGVLLSYASPLGHALLDRELYLPRAWTDDRERCRQASIPEERCVATTPQLARQMLARALAAGVPAAWVTGDRVYGEHRPRRGGWKPTHRPLAVSGQAYVGFGTPPRQVNALLASVPVEGWIRLRAGDGARGPRWDDWRWLPLAVRWHPAGTAGGWSGGVSVPPWS